MGKFTRLIGLLFVVGTTAQAVTFEDIGTVFSTVATVTNNITTTNDQWRWWCGNLSDGPCMAATVIVGFSILIGGSCSCCLVATGCGFVVFSGGLGFKKFCRCVRDTLNERSAAYNGQREMRKWEMQEIVLSLKQQREKESQELRLNMQKKQQALFFGNLKNIHKNIHKNMSQKKLRKPGEPDMKIFVFN